VYNPKTGAYPTSIAILIPNAAFARAGNSTFAWLGYILGFNFTIAYTGQLANGTMPGMTGYLYGSECPGMPWVVPFLQVFTFNQCGEPFENVTTSIGASTYLVGNYILVRGFGFAGTGYQPAYTWITFVAGSNGVKYWTVAENETPVQTDAYGDFVYITQVPYTANVTGLFISPPVTSTSAPFIDWVLAEWSAGPVENLNLQIWSYWPGYPTPTAISGVTTNWTFIATTSTFNGYWGSNAIVEPRGSGSAIIYVSPTPVVWLAPAAPGTTIGTSTLVTMTGQIMMPLTLVKFPYEATQLITNETMPLLSASQAQVPDVVIVGAGFQPELNLWINFTLASDHAYFNVVNLSQMPAVVPLTNGYAVLQYVIVPDLPGTVTYFSNPAFGYQLSLYNGTAASTGNAASGVPSCTEVFVGTVADLLVATPQYPTGYFSLLVLLVNSTTQPNPLGLPTLVASGPSGNAEYFIYAWPPLYKGYVPYVLLLPGDYLFAYIFGSPVSYSTSFTLPTAHPYALPVYVKYTVGCVGPASQLIGYIVNGTLYGTSFPGHFYPPAKGAAINPFCTQGIYNLYLQAVGPWVPTTTNATVPKVPIMLKVYYIPALPQVVVSTSVTGSGSTANAGEPFVVLVPAEPSVLGLPPQYVGYFFMVSQPTVTAYVLSASKQLWQVPAADVMAGPTVGQYQVYYIYVPPNVTYGQLVVIVTQTATYYFTGQTFTGEAAAEMGIVPPVNTTAISLAVEGAVKQIEANVTAQLQMLQSALSEQIAMAQQTLAGYLYGNMTVALLTLKAAQQALATYIAGNASAVETQISTIDTEIRALNMYMAGNFSQVLSYLSFINESLASAAEYLPTLGTVVQNLENINMYMAGNFSAINAKLANIQSGITTLEGDVTAVGAEVGSVGANVLTLLHDASTIEGYEQAALSYITSANSTLSSMSSTLSSMSSTLSSVSSTLSSVSSTLGSVSSTVSDIDSKLSSVSSQLSSISSTLSSVSSTLSSVSSTVTSESSTLSSMSSTLSSVSSTASTASTEATHASQLAASAATYALAALIVAIIALALIAYVAFAKF
ncbi:MAG: hypothetical protein ACP5HK_07170, partial [Acidilobus sp.]